MRRDADQPIRIRFEYTRYPHWGGRSGYVQFVRHLDPRRHRVDLHGASDSDADLPAWLSPLKPWLKRKIARGGMPWYKLSDLTAEARALAACVSRRCDIVHFLDGEHSGQFLPRLVKHAPPRRVRTVATFHQPPEIAQGLVRGDLLRWFDAVVVMAPSQLPFFRGYLPEEKLHVILHGVDTELFHARAAPNSTTRVRCVTVGHWLRDWSAFGAVAKALPDVDFDVVTSRDIGLGNLPNVFLHRNVDDQTLADLYRGADILFLPLVDATANNALLEGMASGLPVVATDLEAVRAYVPMGAGMFIADNRVEDFQTALRRLESDPPLRHRMGRRARERAEELAWPRLVHRYERLYATVLARFPP